jgi:hypothetical protein
MSMLRVRTRLMVRSPTSWRTALASFVLRPFHNIELRSSAALRPTVEETRPEGPVLTASGELEDL